ncbi:hypothetical protein [Streptomyces subrutilus]|uniref:hypothetical protein n=1 Tax=Streptomyces subrutilus TaxID=36818 RepID=UPI00340E4318
MVGEILVPAGAVARVDPEARTVHVDGTRRQIKAAPEFLRERHLGDPAYREALVTFWDVGPYGGPYGGNRV